MCWQHFVAGEHGQPVRRNECAPAQSGPGYPLPQRQRTPATMLKLSIVIILHFMVFYCGVQQLASNSRQWHVVFLFFVTLSDHPHAAILMADYLLKMFLLHGFNRSPRFGCTLCTSSQKCRESAAPVLSVRVQPYTSAFRAAAESRAKVHKRRLLRSVFARSHYYYYFFSKWHHPALTLCFVHKCTILLHVTTILV